MTLDRKYVIAATVVAFIAWARLTDWAPAVRWVPYAFVAGILTAIAGVLYLVTTISRGVVHDNIIAASHVVPNATPAFHRAAVWEEQKASLKAREGYRRPIIFPNALAFSKSVDGLVNLIIRDYVTSWYGALSPRPLFQNEIDRCIRSVLLTTAARFADLEVVEVGVTRMLPFLTAHLRNFYDAERAVRGKDLSTNVTEGEELNTAIASKYRGGGLHPVASLAYADRVGQQRAYLRAIVVRILPIVLPDNMKTSAAVLTLVQELVSCAVFSPIMTLLADPDFWNQMIVNIGGPMLYDRKSVRRVRAALDQHTPATVRSNYSGQVPRLKPYDGEKQFERFVRAIRNVESLSEARRVRSEVVSQLQRDSGIDSQDTVYLRRLETGKRLLDQKLAILSASDSKRAPNGALPAAPLRRQSTAPANRKQRCKLREVIYDASGLGYFMEYMDRLHLMRLVQFYLVVDGFRNPLDGANDEPESIASIRGPDRMDIAQMYDNYLRRPEFHTPDTALEATKLFLKAGRAASEQDYASAHRAVLRMQTQVYNMMCEKHFDNFKTSDLYFKWLAIDDHPVVSAMQTQQPRAVSPASGTDTESSPLKARRPHLPAISKSGLNKEPELRRAVFSATDLSKAGRPNLVFSEAPRRSLDDLRPALFDDEVEDERMTKSTSNIKDSDSESDALQAAREEAEAVNAMKLALDDIVSKENDRESLFGDSNSRPSLESTDTGLSSERPPLHLMPSEKGKPSIASLGLVGAPSSRGVFVDDLFGDEAERFAEDERDESEGADDSDDDHVQEAAPGDLGLTEAIDALGADIEKLHGQKNVLDSLTAKAELTNNTAELRILQKSEQSLQREIHRKEMQKQQYIVQESDNSLYGRASISIKSVMVGREEDGHEYALYVIEVRRQAGDQMPAATWAVTRRYSQFHELHKRLRARFPAVRELDFPRRQTLFSLQKDFIQRRRTILERYLRSLLLVPAICRSRELRAFLSQSTIASIGTDGTQVDAKDFVTRIYNSVSDGMEEFLGNIPVLDQLSAAGQNLISAATAQMNGSAAIDALDPATQDPRTATEAEVELNAYEAKGAEPFVKPICDLFLEAFELSRGNSWLRGRTVVVILHQLLGGTIERKVREAARNALEDEALAKHIELLQGIMWPGGKQRPPGVPRTPSEQARTRKEAGLILGALIPDLAGSVVGRSNAQAAARKIVAALNNQVLNTHLVFTLLDEVIKITFPEIHDR